MSDLPTPRFKIGQRVWIAETISAEMMLPCPDCLGARVWKVITPAGTEATTTCLRCNPGYSSPIGGTPPLKYYIKKPYTRGLTIGSVRLETHARPGEQIAYMCVETGIGSGGVYYEPRLYASEEAAMTAATLDADAANAVQRETPQRLVMDRFSTLRLNEAIYAAHNDSVWNAWWAYRRIIDDIEGLLKDKDGDVDRDALEEIMRWEADHRDRPEIGLLLEMVTQAVDSGSTEKLAALLTRLPYLRQLAAEKEPASI